MIHYKSRLSINPTSTSTTTITTIYYYFYYYYYYYYKLEARYISKYACLLATLRATHERLPLIRRAT